MPITCRSSHYYYLFFVQNYFLIAMIVTTVIFGVILFTTTSSNGQSHDCQLITANNNILIHKCNSVDNERSVRYSIRVWDLKANRPTRNGFNLKEKELHELCESLNNHRSSCGCNCTNVFVNSLKNKFEIQQDENKDYTFIRWNDVENKPMPAEWNIQLSRLHLYESCKRIFPTFSSPPSVVFKV